MTKEKKTKEEKAVEKELDQLKQENAELLEKLQRVSADYANFQKRAPKQIAEAIAFEKERIVKSVLPAMDNFEHTLSHAESAENVEAIAKGVKIIYDQMLDVLKSHNVEQIKALGEKFDPSMHQAMMQTQDEEKEDGIVLEEYQKGYKLNGRVIRPAKVVVNKLAVEQQQSPEDEYDSESSEETDQ
jgi:molecular chaperone GrpE